MCIRDRFYSSDLSFFKYYMIANLLTNNNKDKISERDIVYALEENGYTDSEDVYKRQEL